MRVDWQSADNLVLLNPRLPVDESAELKQQLEGIQEVRGHVWVATSGSTAASPGQIKWTALAKAAILASAHAVNNYLNSDHSDIWLNPLPSFHVGGLGISARAHLSGAQVVVQEGKWEAPSFHLALVDSQATLTALVPAQLFDLVQLNLSPPPSLRAVIIGGGALQEPLYEKATALGWQLLPSYGLTEAASQVATADPALAGQANMPPLQLLPHIQARLGANDHLQLKSPALLTCYALKRAGSLQLVDPKQNGWFETEDRAALSGNTLQIFGRDASFIKIGGESCDLLRLEAILEALRLTCPIDMALVPVSDDRLGHVIHLAAAGPATLVEPLVEQFQQQVLPFERIRKIHYLESLPRTPLAKLILAELKRQIGVA